MDLQPRNDLMKNMKNSLISDAKKCCDKISCNTLSTIDIEQSLLQSNCLCISAPMEEPPMLQMITISSLQSLKSGQSIKPGNIKLNIKNLIDSLPDIISFSVSMAIDIPILKVCAALSLWKMIRKVSMVEITKGQAIVILALWKNCDSKHKIKIEYGFEKVNLLCRQLTENEFTWTEYIDILNELENLQSIEVDMNGIWLREWVSLKYS